jgi:lipopolysaccharide transport system ATP-binding protein
VAAPFRRLAATLRGEPGRRDENAIWALRDVSFTVAPGEVLGVIGRNGAGKTTLLKLLSRITEPTAGRAEIRGRVGSLLEVGTGFHPELTGRENVYLNGAILGMTRAEIGRKFDAIVAFAEVEPFLDTPVKHYSSGMSVRLAFAVAAHLEPEVLLIDEVLAVGDAGFQKKCLASIRESTSGGRTALVVSHNMAFVRALCSRVLLLSQGRVADEGTPTEVIRAYHDTFRSEQAAYEPPAPPAGKSIFIARALIRSTDGTVSTEIPCGQSFRVELGLEVTNGSVIKRPWIGIRIFSWHGDLVAHVANREAGFDLPAISRSATVVCDLREINLLPGEYFLGVVVADADKRVYDQVEQALTFAVTEADVFGSGLPLTERHGRIYLPSRWRVEAPTEAPVDASVVRR